MKPVLDRPWGYAGQTVRSFENVPYLSASDVVFHEDAPYQLYVLKAAVKTVSIVAYSDSQRRLATA